MSDHYPYDSDHEQDTDPTSFSRRDILKSTAAIVGGGAAAIVGGGTAFAQAPAQAPAVITGWKPATAGRKFRALTRYRTTMDVQELTLNAIQPRQVVVRVQAAQACYTVLNALTTANAATPAMNAAIFGHGAVGIVEEVGPMVKRVQAGDRVLVVVTGQCGECYQCLRGRAANCQAGFNRPNPPAATMADGTPVIGNLGGFAELLVAWEEMTIPIFSNHDAAELSNLTCVAMCGLGMAMVRAPIDPGASVVVFGAGPIGLAAIQGARIQGAAQIIAIEPIRYRRDLATKVGATAVLDPNAFENAAAMIARLREMTAGPTDRPFAGGRNPAVGGPDFILEAVGGERFIPKVERAARDPHGVEVLQTMFTLCPPGGTMRTCGVGFPMGATVTFPAGGWTNSSKNHVPGNLAGVQMKRDLPRWTRLFESGQFNGAALVGTKVPLDRWREALDAAAYRTAITGIVTFPT